MKKLEQTIDSREVAEMLEKEHKNVLRDITRYINQLSQLKIEPAKFFMKTNYTDEQGKKRPCYKVTKMGCEFLAHKLTGVKGTAFTARYIERFHQMEELIREASRPKMQEQIRVIPEFSGKFVKEKQLAAEFIQDYIVENKTDSGVYRAYMNWCMWNDRIYLTSKMFYEVKKKVEQLRLDTGSWKPMFKSNQLLMG